MKIIPHLRSYTSAPRVKHKRYINWLFQKHVLLTKLHSTIECKKITEIYNNFLFSISKGQIYIQNSLFHYKDRINLLLYYSKIFGEHVRKKEILYARCIFISVTRAHMRSKFFPTRLMAARHHRKKNIPIRRIWRQEVIHYLLLEIYLPRTRQRGIARRITRILIRVIIGT